MCELLHNLNLILISSVKGIYIQTVSMYILNRWIQYYAVWCHIDLSVIECIFSFFLSTTPPYNSFSPEGIFTNTLSLLIVLYGALIFWIATRPQWKRPKEPDSSILQSKGGAGEEVEGTITMSLGDKSEAELNNEVAARKRNFGLDEASQRSTM